jgi:hypothetical protein
MSKHRQEVEVPLPVEEVAALFRADSAAWLRPFLRLACESVNDGGGAPCAPRFRLGPAEDGAPATEAAFSWSPRVGAPTFTRLRGRWTVRPERGASTLTLEGRATGGSPQRTDAIMAALVQLVRAAVVARHTREG